MTTPDQSVRKRRRWRVAVAALAASGLVLASGLLWLTRSETGSAWLLARVPGLTLAGSRGSLAGGAFAAERIELRMGSRTLSVQRLAWRDADWSWRPHDGALRYWRPFVGCRLLRLDGGTPVVDVAGPLHL